MGTWYYKQGSSEYAVYRNDGTDDVFTTSGDYTIKYVDDNGCETTRIYKVTCGTPPQPTECTCTSAQIGNLQPYIPSQPAAGWTQPYSAATFTADTSACADASNFRAVPIHGDTDFLGDTTVVKTTGVDNAFHIVSIMSTNTSTSPRTQKIGVYVGNDKCGEVTITQSGNVPPPAECTCTNAQIDVTPITQDAGGHTQPYTAATFTATCTDVRDFGAAPILGDNNFLGDTTVVKTSDNNFHIVATIEQNTGAQRTQDIQIYVASQPCKTVTITQRGVSPSTCNCNNANIVITSNPDLDAAGSEGEYVTIAKFTSSCVNAQFTVTTLEGGYLNLQQNVEIGTGEYLIKAIVYGNGDEQGRDLTVKIFAPGNTTTPCVNNLVIHQNGIGVRTCNNNVTSFGSRCDEDGKPIPTITFNMSEMWNTCGAHNKIQYVVMRGSSLISAYGFDMDASTPEITQDLSRVSLPGEVTVSWSNFVSDTQVSVKGENTGTIPEWRKDYIKVNERNSKLFCDGNYKISADLMDGTASTETVKEHLTDDQITQMITIDPVIDTPLEPRQHTITLSNQNVCPVSWNFTPTCNTYTVITDWKEISSKTLDPPVVWTFSTMPQYVTTSISANVRIERDGVDITSQCGYIKFYLYAFTLSGTFARCDVHGSYEYIFEKGEHRIDCYACPISTVYCTTDYTLENSDGTPKDAGTYTAQANFGEDILCENGWGHQNPMSGNFFYVQAVKFWYATDGRWITVNFPAKSNTGSTIA